MAQAHRRLRRDGWVLSAALILAAPASAQVQAPLGVEPESAGTAIAAQAESAMAPQRSPRPAPRLSWAPAAARWDDHPRGAAWTRAVLRALRAHGAPLLETVPRDIDLWCPGYPAQDAEGRAAFWAGLLSKLAWHESTHRPGAVGGGGRWFGLVQISPGTARFRDCAADSGRALLDGRANLRCAVRILAETVPRDEVVAEGNRGVAADWGPLHSSQRRKREDIRAWVRGQEYCARQISAIRPAPRPGATVPGRPMQRPRG